MDGRLVRHHPSATGQQRRTEGKGPSWHDIWSHSDWLEADLLECFGVDVWDTDAMRRRSWLWLRRLIIALFTTESRMARWAHSKEAK